MKHLQVTACSILSKSNISRLQLVPSTAVRVLAESGGRAHQVQGPNHQHLPELLALWEEGAPVQHSVEQPWQLPRL